MADKEYCSICKRLHDEETEPCPMRIARAETMQPGGLEGLTEVDRKWVKTHKISVLNMVEEEISVMMEND